MTDYTRSIEALGRTIQARILPSGSDLIVLISGGDLPHVGSVSVARPEKNGITLEKIVLPTHKDDHVSDLFAESLCRASGKTVAAVCGIHYNDLSAEGLKTVMTRTQQLLKSLLTEYEKREPL